MRYGPPTDLLPRHKILGCVNGNTREHVKSRVDKKVPLANLDDGRIGREARDDGVGGGHCGCL